MREVLIDDPLIGVMVGSYQIDRLIGMGGMGRVYAAVQREVGSRVAIKVLNEEYARDPELAERFFAEARAVNLIAHENIVSVLDLVRLQDGRPVIIMELLEGETLRELVRAGPSPVGAIVHVMIDVLSALVAAHDVGIVHRDLKPDNIIVLPSGRAKVLDFGIAKLVTAPSGSAPRTRTGALVGTPEYMAPEQIGGRAVDARTDLYAAGVVLFEAMTGSRPFEGLSDFEVMRAHVDDPPPSLRARRSEIPAEVEAVVLRALAKAPADRFASATEMANALQAASAGLPETAWRSLSSHGRPYVRPAPLTPRAPRPIPSAPRADLPATAATTPRGRDREDIASTVVDPSPAVRARSPKLVIAAGVVAILGGAGAGILWLRRSPTPTVAVASERATPTRLERPITYDPRAFDPVAFYATARELARTFVPDAELMFLKAVPAHADGTIDLTLATAKQNVYLYRSPAPARASGERDCVGVEPYADKVIAFVYPTTECEYPLVTEPPRCTLAEVWKRAMAQQPFTTATAHVGYFGEEGGSPYWYVDPSMARRTGAGVRVKDDCR
jgi:serine/threonine protein kinase